MHRVPGWLLAVGILVVLGVTPVADALYHPNGTFAGLSDTEESTQKWAATIAFLALQTTNYNETLAQGVVDYLEYLTLRAIYKVYIGNRTYQADRVKASFNNINYPANESDLAQRISEVPQQGIEALVGNVPPGGVTQLFDGLLTITDPQLFSDTSAKIRASIVGGVIAATGIDYNPCMVAAGPLGALLVAQAIGISPQLITVGPSGAVLVAIALNINPTLINIGGSAQPNIVAGFSVAPALVSVQPAVNIKIAVKKAVGSPAITANVIPKPPQPAVTPKPPKEIPGP